jgi:hypothetical protein
MNCRKFFGLLLIGSLSVLPISALELQQLWEVTLPEGQTYVRANIAWSPSDSLPHLFMMGREDLTVYHMTPGSEFEPVLTLPDYPINIEFFGVCLDSTWESSILAHFRGLGDDYARISLVNLATGDSLHAIDVRIREVWGDEWEWLDWWWHPTFLVCSGARDGMAVYLGGPLHSEGQDFDIYNTRTWRGDADGWKGWRMPSGQEFWRCESVRSQTRAYCLMGTDSLLDVALSGRTWGSYSDRWGWYQWDYYETQIHFCDEARPFHSIAFSVGTVMALERADGPAWGLLFFCDDSLTYHQRGPIRNWTVRSNISSPTLAVAFPRRLLPQRIGLVYSATTLTEIDLLDGHAVETIEAPPNVRMLQPYLADDGSWDLMAVFDRSARGYRVTGLLPVDDDANPVLPQFYSLQAYPNPFNEAVKIVYELPRTESVRVHVMDVLGREVARLLDEVKVAGKHELTWNPKSLASGIYFICLRTESTRRVNKLVHVK